MACNTNLKLPEEIWIEIFFRCSVESLLRAKCVCKKWHALITNPNFTFNHLQYQKSHDKGRLLLQHFTEETQQYGYLLFDDETLTWETYHELDHFNLSQDLQLHMEGPIDGLYCLFNCRDRIILWNPALMKFRTLPLPHPHFLPHVKVCQGQIGFGIDPLTNCYKLVLVRLFEDTINGNLSDLNVTVYNFSTNTWRLLDLGDFPLHDLLDNLNTGFLNGIYYWSDSHAIYAFDMGKELFREILGPDISHSGVFRIHPIIYNDHVALLHFREFYVGIWVMLKEGVWIQQFSITHPSVYDSPVGLWKNDEILFAIPEDEDLLGNSNSQMVLYNFMTQEMRKLGPKGIMKCYRASVYYESLVSVDCETEQKGKHGSLNTVSDFFNVDDDLYSDTESPETSLCAFDENGGEHNMV